MTDPLAQLIEDVARALAKEDRIEICDSALYRFSTYGLKARAAIFAALPLIREQTLDALQDCPSWRSPEMAVRTCFDQLIKEASNGR